MASVTIKKTDLDGLAKKLDELADVLTPNEHALLLAVFGMASTALANTVGDKQTESGESAAQHISAPETFSIDRAGTLPPLSDGFKNAFSPRPAGSFEVSGLETESAQNSVGVDVGGQYVHVKWDRATEK
jgi:hypothetical protein